jgi:hypothetical protein
VCVTEGKCVSVSVSVSVSGSRYCELLHCKLLLSVSSVTVL